MTIAEKIFQKLKSAPTSVVQEVLDFVEFLESRHRGTRSQPARTLSDYFGVLSDCKALSGDPVEIQRKLRDEWR